MRTAERANVVLFSYNRVCQKTQRNRGGSHDVDGDKGLLAQLIVEFHNILPRDYNPAQHLSDLMYPTRFLYYGSIFDLLILHLSRNAIFWGSNGSNDVVT
jgi:hypothetical protein